MRAHPLMTLRTVQQWQASQQYGQAGAAATPAGGDAGSAATTGGDPGAVPQAAGTPAS